MFERSLAIWVIHWVLVILVCILLLLLELHRNCVWLDILVDSNMVGVIEVFDKNVHSIGIVFQHIVSRILYKPISLLKKERRRKI